jgi:hypothetical protein
MAVASKLEIGYELSASQKRFVAKAKREGYKVSYDYSGRGMYGRKCPSISVRRSAEFGMKGASSDQLGLGYVIYMAN